ncbi:hypothetical protein [Kutzneria chonburiensis]|uniref:SprT-like domain-containing protein n=1 Tax=Kutzneria chonburiensis TaxID=1483604 RepID=A0ABV6MHV4_9PSEU|nr:hypothetical protein [Kutzneria chonburiensis]
MSAPAATLTTITTQLVTAFEAAWRAIQQRHPDVPEVVVTFGSGTLGMKAGQTRLGHFAAARWQHGEKQLPELFISGEGLQRGALEVLGTLLHEAAHGLAHVREIKDTSRQGRYHNAKFKALGEELGLTLAEDKTIGWSLTTVPETTAKAYAAELDELSAALVAWRYAEVHATSKKKSTNLAVAECACPRKIRVARTTLAEAPITCGKCGVDFVAEDDNED